MSIEATESEVARRREVMATILDCIRQNRTIKLPPFDPSRSIPGEDFALQNIEPNEFSGEAAGYRYQFEGEEDLLHLIVARTDRQPCTPEEARQIVSFLLAGVSPAMIWLKPGTYSQHFYVGHDELLDSLRA